MTLQEVREQIAGVFREYNKISFAYVFEENVKKLYIFVEYSATPTLKEMFELEEKLKYKTNKQILLTTKCGIDALQDKDLILESSKLIYNSNE